MATKKTAVMITNKSINLTGIVVPVDENIVIEWDNGETETFTAEEFDALCEGNDDFEVDEVEIEETAASDSIKTHASADGPKSKMDVFKSILGNLATLDMTSLLKYSDTLDTVRAASNATSGKAEGNKATIKMHAKEALEAVIPTLAQEEQDAIFAESSLTDEAKTKVTALFESTVTVRLAEEVVKLQEAYDAKLQENIEEISASMLKSINVYMNHVAKQWLTENTVAVQSKLKGELVANFMGNLHELMTKHYIDIPEDKVPVVEKLVAQHDELTAKLNEALNEKIELAKTIDEMKRKEVVSTVAEGLTLGQKEKLKKGVDAIVAENSEDFKTKVDSLKEEIVKERTTVTADLADGIVTETNDTVIFDERISTLAAMI